MLTSAAALADPIAVAPDHTVSIGVLAPKVIQDGHGERLVVPVGLQAELTGTLRDVGYPIVPTHQADVLLQPTVQASGCTPKRDEWRCSAWVSWRVAGSGPDATFLTETDGLGGDLVAASAATWQAAADELLADPGFVRTLHLGPLNRFDCAFAGQMASVPVRIAPEPLASHGHDNPYDERSNSSWTWGFILGTQEGWLLSGLALMGGGAAIAGASGAAAANVDDDDVVMVLDGVALFGMAHFVVGASMLGLEFTEGTRARVHLTGNGLGVTGRF